MNVSEIVLKQNGFDKFNPVQEKCLDKLDSSLVVSSPTASGKTVIAELFLLESILKNKKKVIYTCPLRALASEHYKDFKNKYRDISFALSTGDFDSSSSYLKKFDCVFTTYEKLASLIRHKAEFLEDVGVLIVDEIHELDSDRGAVLEIAITQLKNRNSKLNILGLSATIPNAKELSEWLDAKLVKSDWRPVKLIEGVEFNNKIEFLDGNIDDNDIEDEIDDFLENEKQVLIFLNSRKRAESYAEKIKKKTSKKLSEKDKEYLKKISEKILNALEQPTSQCELLARHIKEGSAFHHAGLLSKQREIVEEEFKKGKIHIICATPTLCITPETELWQGTIGTRVDKFENNNARLIALKDKKLKSVRPKQIYKNYNEKSIIEIESNSGHKIRITENHKMFIKRNKKQLFVEAKDIKKTDKIATVGKLWSQRPKNYKLNFFTKNNTNTNQTINSQITYFIGAMLGDGNSGATKEKNIIYYNSNPTIISADKEIFEEIAKACDYLKINCKQCTNFYGTDYIKLPKTKWLREFLINVGVEKGQNKYICNKIKQLGKDKIKSLLQGLFDTDGCFEKRGQISFSNSSYKLVKDIQRLLLLFGVVSRIRTKKPGKIKIYKKEYKTKKSWEISIANKKSILNFYENIGFRIKRKQHGLEILIDKLNSNTKYIECKNCKFKIYTDLFKGRTKEQKLWGKRKINIIKLLGKEKEIISKQIEQKLGFKPYLNEKRLNHHFELITRTRIGNKKLWKLNKIGKKVYYNIMRGQENKIHSYNFCPICRKAMSKKLKNGWRNDDFEKDIYWDFIKTKTTIKEKYDFVYDISLSSKNTDNLFVANGFIVHNSAGVNTPADLVIIPSLYRYSQQGMDLIPVREYKQMSGRSGRPKFSTSGKSIVKANSESQKEIYLEKYLGGELEAISSKLKEESVLRTHILGLIAAGDLINEKSVWKFFENTLYAKQFSSVSEIFEGVLDIIEELKKMDFVTGSGEYFKVTLIGKRVSDLFLDPLSAKELIDALKSNKKFDETSYLFAWSNMSEFFPRIALPKKNSAIILEEFNEQIKNLPFSEEKLFFENDSLEVYFNSLILREWINEKKEQTLFENFGLLPGMLFSKTRIIEWLSYSTIELSKTLGENRHILPSKKLALRVKHGVKEELLPLVELRGVGRARGRKLFRAGIKKPSDIKKNTAKVEKILGKNVSKKLFSQLKISE